MYFMGLLVFQVNLFQYSDKIVSAKKLNRLKLKNKIGVFKLETDSYPSLPPPQLADVTNFVKFEIPKLLVFTIRGNNCC